MKKYIVVLLFSFLGFSQTNFYVKKAGGLDTNPGTFALPWKTIQKAANTANAGSIVNIFGDTYNELVTLNVSGTTTNPIIFKNYQNDIVVISGAGFTGSFNGLIVINSKSNIIIDGLILENLYGNFARGVLVFSNPNNGIENITLRNLKIRNIGYTTNPVAIPTPSENAHGIIVYGTGTSTTDAIRNVTIENCEVYNNINGFSENITVTGNVDGFKILNNSVHNNTNIGIDASGNFNASATPSLDHARNGLISGNTAYEDTSLYSVNSGIYCDGCWNTIIEKNRAYNNQVGITVGCEENGTADNVIVRNNLVYNNTFSGIAIGGYNPATTGIVTNTKVLNNTCFNNDNSNTRGHFYISKTSNCEFSQNTCSRTGSVLFYADNINPQTFSMNYNNYFTNGNATPQVNYRANTINFSSFKTATGNDANSILTDPLFVNNTTLPYDFRLQSTSSAINAGNPSFIPDANETDFYGNPRVANSIVDIGASEKQLPLSIEEKNSSRFKIYPNPTKNKFEIQFEANENKEFKIQIFDLLGKQVLVNTVFSNQIIDVSTLEIGIYLIRIQNENKIETQKLIINN